MFAQKALYPVRPCESTGRIISMSPVMAPTVDEVSPLQVTESGGCTAVSAKGIWKVVVGAAL